MKNGNVVCSVKDMNCRRALAFWSHIATEWPTPHQNWSACHYFGGGISIFPNPYIVQFPSCKHLLPARCVTAARGACSCFELSIYLLWLGVFQLLTTQKMYLAFGCWYGSAISEWSVLPRIQKKCCRQICWCKKLLLQKVEWRRLTGPPHSVWILVCCFESHNLKVKQLQVLSGPLDHHSNVWPLYEATNSWTPAQLLSQWQAFQQGKGWEHFTLLCRCCWECISHTRTHSTNAVKRNKTVNRIIPERAVLHVSLNMVKSENSCSLSFFSCQSISLKICQKETERRESNKHLAFALMSSQSEQLHSFFP